MRPGDYERLAFIFFLFRWSTVNLSTVLTVNQHRSRTPSDCNTILLWKFRSGWGLDRRRWGPHLGVDFQCNSNVLADFRPGSDFGANLQSSGQKSDQTAARLRTSRPFSPWSVRSISEMRSACCTEAATWPACQPFFSNFTSTNSPSVAPLSRSHRCSAHSSAASCQS